VSPAVTPSPLPESSPASTAAPLATAWRRVRSATALLATPLLWTLLSSSMPATAATAAAACPPEARALAADEVRQGLAQAVDRGYLWQAERDGLSIWLYGTVHAAQRSWMFPGPQVMQALRAADQVALELDMLDPNIARRLQTAVLARDDEPPLPAALRRRLSAQSTLACLGDSLQRFRPEMQAITLVALAGRQDGLDPAYGVDGFLGGLAHGLGKPVVSLETPESQIEVLVQPDVTQRDRLIDETLAELERGDAVPGLKRLTQAWADGRLDELENYGQWCHCLDTAEQRSFHERLIDRRNGPLARRAMAIHAAGRNVFVAIGALHMVGPTGLPALLAQQGFAVRRLPIGTGQLTPAPAAQASQTQR
jgi:uncharacterized protein